jgi:hypothetical protein
MMSMPVCTWPLFLRQVHFWRKLEGLPLEQKHCAKTVKGWLGAACVLAAVCLGFYPMRGAAQDGSPSASGNTSPAKKTSSTTSTGSKKHVKAAASGAKASSSSSAKAHSASHPATGKHSKSNTAVAAHSGKSKYASSRKTSKRKPRGQQKIDSERAQAIQEALIREHYMSGTATGTWNQTSEDAMRRYQADHGWQSKTVPDSRALISLGLGPRNEHLLNPDSAMVTGPFPPHAASLTPASHSAQPGARIGPTPSADPAHAVSSDHDAPSPQ